MPPNKHSSARKSPPGATGRPRPTDSASSKPSTVKRRSQLRQSQKAHREKQKAVSQYYQLRAEQLEAKVSRLDELFSELHRTAERTQLNIIYSDLYAQIYGIRQYLEPQEDASPAGTLQSGNESNSVDESTKKLKRHREDRRQSSQDTYVSKTLEVSPPSSYGHYESSFARRLQRLCLEYMYRLCLDTRTDPSVLYRHFRLAPYTNNLKKTMPAFRQLVRAGPGEKLEFTTQSFYCIGGAASHYPQFDISTQGFAQENAGTFKRSVYRNSDRWDYEVNLGVFFSSLLRGFAMLGGAPGFKRTEVEVAFRNALTRLPRISAS